MKFMKVGRPKTDNPLQGTSIRLEPVVRGWLKGRAKSTGTTVSAMVVAALISTYPELKQYVREAVAKEQVK